MLIHRRARGGYTLDDYRTDPLVQRLRDAVLNNRDKNSRDRVRAVIYNMRSKRRGLPFRAPIR